MNPLGVGCADIYKVRPLYESVSMEMTESPVEPEMHRREIKMTDGRYLFFYTFEMKPSKVETVPEEKIEEKVDH